MFETILAKDQASLTDDEKGFLMARRSYMNDDQKKRYAEMIDLHEKGELFSAPVEDENDLKSLSLARLKEIAKVENVEVKGLKSVAEFARAIQATRDEKEA